jgi:hypothetical protein
MEQQINEIKVNGVDYIRKDLANSSAMANKKDGLQLVMIRTYSAGVHYGYLKERNGKEVTLLNSVRVWYWSGAASLSQLSQEGTTKPTDCKFSIEVPEILLLEAIEIIPISDKAIINFNSVKKWKV